MILHIQSVGSGYTPGEELNCLPVPVLGQALTMLIYQCEYHIALVHMYTVKANLSIYLFIVFN